MQKADEVERSRKQKVGLSKKIGVAGRLLKRKRLSVIDKKMDFSDRVIQGTE